MLVLASGQLAVASTVILTQGQAVIAGAPQPQAWGQPISVSLYNSGVNSETVLLKLLRNGNSTATVVGRFVLATLESASVSCLVLGPGDALYGQTTDATSVDFTVFEANPGSFQAQSYTSSGELKLANGAALTGPATITSASSSAFVVGPNGATNPVFRIDDSTSSQADGIKLTGLAAGSGATLLVITSGTNSPLNINAAGSGNIVMNQAGTGITLFTTGLQIADAKNIALATTTGTSFGSATTQKLSLYGVTPIVQPINSVDVFTGLVNLGLRASGGTAAMTIPGALGMVDANITATTVTGTSFAGATTQKISFYGVTPITQPAASSSVSVTGTTGASTGVSLDTTFTGGGTAQYTIGGIVVKLKALGLLAT